MTLYLSGNRHVDCPLSMTHIIKGNKLCIDRPIIYTRLQRKKKKKSRSLNADKPGHLVTINSEILGWGGKRHCEPLEHKNRLSPCFNGWLDESLCCGAVDGLHVCLAWKKINSSRAPPPPNSEGSCQDCSTECLWHILALGHLEGRSRLSGCFCPSSCAISFSEKKITWFSKVGDEERRGVGGGIGVSF